MAQRTICRSPTIRLRVKVHPPCAEPRERSVNIAQSARGNASAAKVPWPPQRSYFCLRKWERGLYAGIARFT